MADKVLWTGDHLKLEIGRQVLFSDASFSINGGERVALVGRNGCGKSTLMKIIAGLDTLSGGEITMAKNIRIAYMPQDFTLDSEATVRSVVTEGVQYFTGILKRYQELPAASPEHERLEHLLTYHDAWDTTNKIETILAKLNLNDAEKKCSLLSGGERRRVMLARSIIAEPDLLLLDEPTNHLDVEMIAWIEDFLASYKGACLFVTHDRYFLDRLATRIVELDNGRFFSCAGSYADFLAAKEEREYNEDVLEQKRKNFLRLEVEWVRRSPKARLRRNLGRLKRYDEIAAQKGPVRTGSIDLIIPKAMRLGNKVVEVREISKNLGGKELFRNFSYEFSAGQKTGIVGGNGCGKTTLLKMITRQLQPDSGEVFVAPTVEFNYIDQGRIALNPENSVLEEISEGHDFINLGEEKISIWGYLKRFLFEDDRINTKIKNLSGGEKARLTLAKILRGGGNFLILDEPTNDLDLSTLRILEEALIHYDGCLVVVSHDRYFLNRVCDHIIAFEHNADLVASVGDYDYYLAKKQERSAAAERLKELPKKNNEPVAPVRKNQPKKLSFKEARELESLEGVIAGAESRIAEIEAMFADPDFFRKHGRESVSLQEELDQAKADLENHYLRWEELETKRASFEK